MMLLGIITAITKYKLPPAISLLKEESALLSVRYTSNSLGIVILSLPIKYCHKGNSVAYSRIIIIIMICI